MIAHRLYGVPAGTLDFYAAHPALKSLCEYRVSFYLCEQMYDPLACCLTADVQPA